ncbi:uncharacterized protein BP5553_09786 [Venustampulla echinocandica]|uniref:Inner kinetochore subunit AME1 domain-containing protein n=1 Tax=Venustampulla echinocandica TaxID=2656787 RepID=A0A370TAQ4_9HELO|nr:uncharacterized protein BP5553_09786 [Venustampulla echinocandica]RDL30997.1 hypothetical protein BP5553_09786 [Venustampulla echinocandica]
MASTREERMQQRLRGAQRREVKEVDFELAFPIAQPLEGPVVSSQRSPQPELPRASVTPVTRNRGHSNEEQDLGVAAQPQLIKSGNIDANISAKRRKLDTDQAPPSARSTRSTRAAPQLDIYSLPEDGPRPASKDDASKGLPAEEAIQFALLREYEPEPTQIVSAARSKTPLSPPPLTAMSEEITESPTGTPGNGLDTRAIGSVRAIGRQVEGMQNLSPIRRDLATPIPRTKRKRGQATPTPIGSRASQDQRNQSAQTTPSDDEVDELSPSQAVPPSRKRNSVVEDNSSAIQENETRSPEAGEEVAEAIGDLDAAAILEKNRGRKIARNIPAIESPASDEVEAVSKTPSQVRRRRQQNFSSPSKQRHPKIPSKTKSQKPTQPAKTARLRGGSPIPVTVHRLTEQPLWEEDESDADVLNSGIPYAKRPGVNTVDVLSQVCQEIIGTRLETLEDGVRHADDSTLRREYKTKWNAIKSFGEELQSRLLAHTINLDNAYSFEKRVREEHKRKQALRDEILRIRAERQQVAVRMDEIRINHEDEAKRAQERDSLNTMAHDIELAIDSGRSQAPKSEYIGDRMTGIEVLLKRVATQISNKGDSGGILKQIKEFNGFLTRAALALESRKV